MNGIKDLLLNVLIIMLPIFFYQMFWVDKYGTLDSKRNQTVIGLLSAATIILCMTFPFSIFPGLIYDLRAIPLLIGILYGGYGAGIFVTAVLVAYRYYLGGTGFFYAVIAYPMVVVPAFYLAARYNSYSRKCKMVVATGLSLLSALSVTVVFFFLKERLGLQVENPVVFFIGYCLIIVLAMWLVVYLIETIRENTMMRLEMQRTEKLHVLGELAASIAHEIRNPMTVARGFLQLLHERKIPEEKQQTYIKMVVTELDRAQSIITDYLSFAKPQVEKLEDVDVSEQIRHVVNVMSSFAILRNVEIQTDLESGLVVHANPEKLTQVLMNLVKNGIEAMPQGGTLQVRTDRKDDHVLIDIIDTGGGMTKEEVQRLGTPFYSTKESGTGLGLMVSYRIIEALNGKIEVASEKGKGTQFSITLPAA